MGTASSLTLYSSTSLNDALAMQPSVVKRFFEGRPFEDWKKGKEAELKIHAAAVDRLNTVIRSIGNLGKVLARRRM